MDNAPLQLWGGIECTVNRIEDQYRDQLVENGHAAREDDLDLLAELGFSSLRYPVLWERLLPDQTHPSDWSSVNWKWSDQRLERLRHHRIEPIVGLVHHGSGPRHTSLLQESFVIGIAEYAEQIARRYPWIEAYTPINEPLTTARFSCLYGHWFPHCRADDAFATALVTQCLATAEAMRAIRRVNPAAQLILTEDLGKTHSTDLLSAQAEFENHRRWLSIDLLMGRVCRQHPLYDYLARSPRIVTMIDCLNHAPLPPDLLGFNYYLTSERYLDHCCDSYPAWSHGGNYQFRYADVEAVRVLPDGIDGRERLLTEAWQRYGLPMAITEVHLCGTVHEQILWLNDAWQGAQRLRSEHVDIRAVTVWSLFGSFDWNSLCTCRHGHYEPGVFDVRSGIPVPTELAEFVKALANGERELPGQEGATGWWQDDSRMSYPPVSNRVDAMDLPQYEDPRAESLVAATATLMEDRNDAVQL